MKKLFCSVLINLFVLTVANGMERPAEQEGIEIAFKDHLPTPDGGHIRALYNPTKDQMYCGTFNSRGELYQRTSSDTSLGNILKNRANTKNKLEIVKICGIAQYRHYLIYSAIGSLERERDTVVLCNIDNLEQTTGQFFSFCKSDRAVIDISSIVIEKSAVKLKAIFLDNKNKKYDDEIVDFMQKSRLFPYLE